MFSSFVPLSIPRFGFGRASKVVDVPSVEIHQIETSTDKRTRRFKHLLKLNHVNHAVLLNQRKFHNHLPHLLGSAYILGGDPDHLNDCYDAESKGLVNWEDAPNEIARHDWRDNLGKREYERGYLDFFEDELVLHGYDWKAVVNEYLLGGKEPLVSWLVADLGHPLIHLGYGFEVESREVCMEALTLASVTYSPMHKYIDDPSYHDRPPAYETTSPLEGLARIAADSRFDKLFSAPGGDNFSRLFSDPLLEQIVLSHWTALKMPDPTKTLKEYQLLATALLLSSHGISTSGTNYDFYLVHLLTTSHALRILIPLLPSTTHLPLLRQWYLMTIGYYISQLRPTISLDKIRQYDTKGRDWEYVKKMSIEGQHSTDAHYVKGLRAMLVGEETWGDVATGDETVEKEETKQSVWLKAAVKFAEEFGGWGGFAVEGEME